MKRKEGWQEFVEIMLTVVETELCFLEMEIEGVFCYAVELQQAAFGEAPEARDAIYVTRTCDELIVAMVDTEVLVEAHIDQAVMAAPAVGVQDGFRTRLTTDNRL